MIHNWTEHDIRVRVNRSNLEATPDPSDIVYPPSGRVARVTSHQEPDGEVDGIPVMRTVFDPVEVPDDDGNYYIVSAFTAQKLPGCPNILVPNTAPGTDIRDPQDARKSYAVFEFQRF